jgi:hypothetical protein
MEVTELRQLVKKIVEQANALKDKHTRESKAHVNYAAIFSHSEQEYDSLLSCTKLIGKIAKETPTGPVLIIKPIDTVSGKLRVLKIRMPDKTRPERGDADFTVDDYQKFKADYLSRPGFKLIERPGMEMIEIMDPLFDVRAYFSNPPLDKQLGL